MFRLTCIHVYFLFAFAWGLAGATAIVPGMTSALSGDIVGHSDFELNLRPPEESASDVQETLDALMKSEGISSKALQIDFASEKDQMLEAEKAAIKNVIASAFKPLLEKVQAL